MLFRSMSISSALGAVIMPRTSNLIAEERMDEFKVEKGDASGDAGGDLYKNKRGTRS